MSSSESNKQKKSDPSNQNQPGHAQYLQKAVDVRYSHVPLERSADVRTGILQEAIDSATVTTGPRDERDELQNKSSNTRLENTFNADVKQGMRNEIAAEYEKK